MGPLGNQRMSDLSSDRVEPGKPSFSYVGVDCFRPFLVKRLRSQMKQYGCILTCCSIRAVHIQKLDTMDTDSFINAFKHFEIRWGRPELVRSDNGSDFVGGERMLHEAIQFWNQEETAEHMRQQEIQWVFNPPTASHMWGLWECQIRSVRWVLGALLQNAQALDDEGLSTLFCEVESIIYNRPITTVSDNPRDLEPLTPNHLLLLRAGVWIPLANFDRVDAYMKCWKHVQFVANCFWRHWVWEYLPILQLWQKWTRQNRNLAEGDVILV